MSSKLTPKDFWDAAKNKNINNIPKKYQKAYNQRILQKKYVFQDKNNKNVPFYMFCDLVNQSSNVINPQTFCENIKDLFSNIQNIKIKILDTDDIVQNKLNLIHSVDKISSKLLICEYINSNSTTKSPIAIVGKGVTIDTGGYAIKSNSDMKHMHLDKTGGVMALYILYTLACKKIKNNVIVAVPLVQNNISHCATKPGDIIHSYSGLTVEITNPDAEGRLILADSISYMLHVYNPRYIVDMGTLTSLPYCKVSFSYFTLSHKLRKLVSNTGKSNMERLYEMPPWIEYKDYTKSTRADIKNAEFECPDQFVSVMFLLNFIPTKWQQRWLHINLCTTSVKDDISVLEGSYSLISIVQKMMTL